MSKWISIEDLTPKQRLIFWWEYWQRMYLLREDELEKLNKQQHD